MELANITINQILIMLLLIIIGIICYKVKLIDINTNKKLSNILLMLINPMLILMSFQREFTKDLLQGLIISFILAFITHLFSIFISYVLLKKKIKNRKKMNGSDVDSEVYEYNPNVEIERLSAIYSNCGFMGFPLANGIFGSEGVFYITAYLTVFNLFVWTHGIIIMSGDKDWKNWRKFLKTLLSPSIIAIGIGVFLFLLQIKLPAVLYQSFDYIAAMNTPFAMLIAGVTIAQTDIGKIFGKSRLFLVTFIKLLLIPVTLLFLYSRFPIGESIVATAVLAAACPSATTCTLFAIKYEKNALYAAEIFAVTTVLSMVTMPIIMGLAGYLM